LVDTTGSEQPAVIAFYLPQFHPIPENDGWWGPGFTEWTNVAAARSLFRGHRQPHLPGQLGFYDLRLPEARESQAHLAQTYGVTAFCYWHYWFAGKKLLQRPLEEVLATGAPELPFCLGWANQSWSGVWHGAPDRILAEQTYPGEEDDQAHFDYLCRAFDDPRYLRVDDRPVLVIFRPTELPDASDFTARWQAMARDRGMSGLHLVAYVGDDFGWGPEYERHRKDGFDAGVYVRFPFRRTLLTRFRERLQERAPRVGPKRYRQTKDLPRAPGHLEKPLYPCVYSNWDNTPRSGRGGMVLTNSSPERFRRHLTQALSLAHEAPIGRRLVWIRSWNEWAEGNYLEPDRDTGLAYLEVLREELNRLL
jgi:lipopolysaccharide biosynthesis protein